MVYHGAWRIDQGTPDAATAAKVEVVASECALRVTEQATRIHGGPGIMRDHTVGRFHRDAFVYVIGEGTSDIRRNIIAGDLEGCDPAEKPPQRRQPMSPACWPACTAAVRELTASLP